MENWRAGLIGVGIVLIGVGGYSSLEGVWKGVSLVAAGIALVLLGLSLEHRPGVATETEQVPREVPDDELDVTVPMAAVAVEDADATAPLARVQIPEPEASEPEPESRTAAPEPADPEPAVAEALVVAEVGEVDGSPVMTVVEGGPAPAQEAVDETAHGHDQPMLGHSELVSHLRDYHEGVPFDGSTIQLRLLHERAHA